VASLSFIELRALWIQEGGRPDSADTAAAIALAESGGDTSRINNTAFPNRPGYHPPAVGNLPEYSVGLWQINMLAHPQYSEEELLTQLGNVRAALAISSNGLLFGAWSTFTSGAYKAFLPSGSGTPVGPPAPGSSGAEPEATRALGGWADLQHAVNKALPFAATHGRSVLDDARKRLAQVPGR